jgi:hypothetical protein
MSFSYLPRITTALGFAVFALLLVSLLAPGVTHAAPTCTDIYTKDASVPTGYGAAYNLFSAARELMIKTVTCGDTSVTVQVNGSATTYVYKQGYVWDGSRWQLYSLTSNTALFSELWYPGTATGNISIPSGDQTKYYVGYICQKVDAIWKCGCRDTTCATAMWQLQAVHKVPESSGPVCGNSICESGETTTSCPADCSDSSGGACDVPKNDLFKNPFSKNSAHHRPIGTGARYASDADPSTISWLKGHAMGFNINNGYGVNIYQIATSDPTRTITWVGPHGPLGIPITMRVPTDARNGSTEDSQIILYDPDTKTAHEFYSWRPGTAPKASIRRQWSTEGLGHTRPGGARVGVSASGVAGFHGLLRGFEVNTPGYKIQHALQGAIPMRTGLRFPSMGNGDIVWPASTRDGYSESQWQGNIPYGALFALPASVDINSLDLSEPGRRLAQAIQDYGIYIVDNGEVDGVVLRADQFMTSTVYNQLRNDMRKVYPKLRMILNNTEGQPVAGGGTPLAPNCAFDAE